MLNFIVRNKSNRGFTLIELLIVIAIIGILSGMVMVVVGDAVNRAEDAQRLLIIRQLSNVLARQVAVGVDDSLEGCTAADSAAFTCGHPTNQPIIYREFRRMIDPEHNFPPTIALPICTSATTTNTAPCQFGISDILGINYPHTNDYQICFWLEVGAGGQPAGLNSIRDGVFYEGCL